MPIITLSSDIGQQDYIIAAVKGQLLQIDTNINIIDVSHYLLQNNFAHAGYTCKQAFQFYPPNSFHIVLLDVFSANKKMVIAQHQQQFIICPDNGILSFILPQKPIKYNIFFVQEEDSFLIITQKIAYYIRAIIANNYVLPETSAEAIVEKLPLKPTYGSDWVEGQILFVDHFENVIINITQQEFEEHKKGRRFKILFKRDEVIDQLHHHYASVPESEMVAFFNSAGYLEIAINKGNMAGLFGLQRYDDKMNKQSQAMQNKWFYQSVKIFFE
jgi:S-adenosylmethionine hydrolase